MPINHRGNEQNTKAPGTWHLQLPYNTRKHSYQYRISETIYNQETI